MSVEKPELDTAAADYFNGLPNLEFPQALVAQYPRIANTLFTLKGDQRKLRDYFDSLTNDTRSGRRGFPFDVLMNIQDLREVMLGDVNKFVLDDTSKWVS